jgi:hypothetical protein
MKPSGVQIRNQERSDLEHNSRCGGAGKEQGSSFAEVGHGDLIITRPTGTNVNDVASAVMAHPGSHNSPSGVESL